MVIGVLTVEIEIPEAQSLKDKRRVLNRVRDRVAKKFNAAIAEVDEQDVWNYAVMGVAVVSNSQQHANQQLSSISSFIQTLHDFILEDISMEFLHL